MLLILALFNFIFSIYSEDVYYEKITYHDLYGGFIVGINFNGLY